MITIKPSILLTDIFISNENETCPGCGCVCPCECTDCEECSLEKDHQSSKSNKINNGFLLR